MSELKAVSRKIDQVFIALIKISHDLDALKAFHNDIVLKETKSHRSIPPRGALKHRKVQDLIISLRKKGESYLSIDQAIKRTWPNNPEFHSSQSSIHRFCVRAKKGQYKEFGIENWD